MSRAQDKDVKGAEPSTNDAPGRVEIDNRGHNVWRWARDVIESTSLLLKRLQNKDLALEPTQEVPVVAPDAVAKDQKSTGKSPAKSAAKAASAKTAERHPAQQTERSRDGGFDPYNSR